MLKAIKRVHESTANMPLVAKYIGVDPSILEEFHDSTYALSDIKSFTNTLAFCFCITLSNVKIQYYTAVKLNRFDICKLKKCARRICTITQLFNHNHNQHSTPYEFFIVPHTSKRTFPNPNGKELVGAQHINGGFTYVNSNKIYIFRLEEFPKVMLHEVIHHLPYHTQAWPIDITNKFYTLFNIDATGCPTQCNVRLEPNEAVVEFWATIYQLMFIAAETPNEHESRFESLLRSEQQWSRQQSNILSHYRTRNTPWREETHAFSYIVLKNILLQNAKSFMKLQPPYEAQSIYNFIENAYKTNKKVTSITRSHARSQSRSMRMTRFGDL